MKHAGRKKKRKKSVARKNKKENKKEKNKGISFPLGFTEAKNKNLATTVFYF